VANYDFMATMADLFGIELGAEKDGVSYLGLLTEGKPFTEHEYIVYAGHRGPAIVARDGWKLRMHMKENFSIGVFGEHWDNIENRLAMELYFLPDDAREEKNLIEMYPDKADELCIKLMDECDGNFINGTTRPHFLFYSHNYRRKLRAEGKMEDKNGN
jgi:arylsulfatase A-like enzyme